MHLRRMCVTLGLSLLLFAGACAAPAPAPTGIVLLPSATFSPSPKPNYPPAVRDTATALALAAQLGGTPTPAASDTLSPEAPTGEPPATGDTATEPAASETPAEPGQTDTPIVELSVTPNDSTPAATRTPIGNATGQALPGGCSALHTVQATETLTAIAEQYAVSVQALARANKISATSELFVGQVLCIPQSAGSAPTAAKPSPTPSPTGAPASGLAIVSLTVDPNPVDRGAVVRLSWTVRNAVAVALWPLSFDYHLNQWFRQTSATYTGTGDAELTVAVPEDARGPLRYELEAQDSHGTKVTAQTDLIQPFCNPAFFGGPVDPSFCLHPAESAPAEFQRFERGYMVWRSDTGDIFVLTQDPGRYSFWLLWSATGATEQIGVPPAGEYAPGGHFVETWTQLGPAELGGSQALRDMLGWATSPVKSYTLTEQVRLDGRFPDFDTLYLGWPDGQVAQMFTGGGIPHTGTVGPTWLLFTPTQ
jgi:LysM repeat protein